MTEGIYDEAELRLRRATGEDLLKAFASLTHRIHAAERGRSRDDRLALDLRGARDRVEAEVLRRMAQ